MGGVSNRRRNDGDMSHSNINSNGGAVSHSKKTATDDGSGKRKERPWSRSQVVAGLLLLVAAVVLGQYGMSPSAETEKKSKFSNEKRVLTPEEVERSNRLCDRNIFAPSLNVSLASVAAQADEWLSSGMTDAYERAKDPSYREHNHERFFPVQELAPCREEQMTCVGGSCEEGMTTGKKMCGISNLQQEEDCIIYSVGYNGNWDFEMDMLQRTKCQVHFFDCMGPKERYRAPTAGDPEKNARLHIHHVCLGTRWRQGPTETPPICEGRFSSWEKNHAICGDIRTLEGIQKKFNHSRIDLLRMDVDGIEYHIMESWPVLRNIWTSERVLMPMQILMQVHYATYYKPLWSPATQGLPDRDRTEFKLATDLVDFQSRLLQMGYAAVRREANPQCVYCSDVTLVRFRCPGTVAYEKLPVVG